MKIFLLQCTLIRKPGKLKRFLLKLLGLEEALDQDIRRVGTLFKINDCQSGVFGKTPEVIINEFGLADIDTTY